MNIILHGDNLVASRKKLSELIDAAKKDGVELLRLDGRKISETELRQALESQSLFGEDRLVVIESLLSSPRSKEKNNLVSIVATEPRTAMILWEGKRITPVWLKQLKQFKVELFKTPVEIFRFLDSLRPGNATGVLSILHNNLKKERIELVFYMLSRRVSDLIIASHPNADKLLQGAPWQKGKLKSQAQHFKTSQLLKLHRQLLAIDEAEKTGKTFIPLDTQLDLLLAKL